MPLLFTWNTEMSADARETLSEPPSANLLGHVDRMARLLDGRQRDLDHVAAGHRDVQMRLGLHRVDRGLVLVDLDLNRLALNKQQLFEFREARNRISPLHSDASSGPPSS